MNDYKHMLAIILKTNINQRQNLNWQPLICKLIR